MAVRHTTVIVPMTADVHSSGFVWDGDDWQLRPDAPGRRLTGCDPNGIAQSGDEFAIFNDSAEDVTLVHNSASSTAGHRLMFADGADHTLFAGDTCWGIRREDIASGPDGWYVEIP